MISNIRKALPAIKEDKNESHMVPPHESAGLANSSSNLKIFFFFSMSHVVSNFCQRSQILNFFSWPGTQLKMYLEYHGVIAVSDVKQGDVDGLHMNAKVCCNSMNIISTHPTGEIF